MTTFNAYAATTAHGSLQPFSFDPGEIGSEEVEIKVSHCGLCHSDLSMLDNEWGMSQYKIACLALLLNTLPGIGQERVFYKIVQVNGLNINLSL